MSTALVFLAEGFEEMEAIITIDVLRRAGVEVTTAAIGDGCTVTGSHAIAVQADTVTSALPAPESLPFDAVILPGGQPGTNNLRADARVKEWVRAYDQAGKLVAAICAAPLALEAAGILAGKSFTSHPSTRSMLAEVPGATYVDRRVVTDGTTVTSRGPGTAFEFALTLVELLVGKETANDLGTAMLVNR